MYGTILILSCVLARTKDESKKAFYKRAQRGEVNAKNEDVQRTGSGVIKKVVYYWRGA
jgi:hypothetical protein